MVAFLTILFTALFLAVIFTAFIIGAIKGSKTKNKNYMWTKETLINAAAKYKNNVKYKADIESLDSMYLEDIDNLVEDAFIEGCKFIINNSQKY